MFKWLHYLHFSVHLVCSHKDLNKSIYCIWWVFFRSILSIFISLHKEGPNPGRESWLVTVQFKGVSPLRLPQELPTPQGLTHWRRNNPPRVICSSPRGPPGCPGVTSQLPRGLSCFQVCQTRRGHPCCLPRRLWEHTGFVCGVGVLAVPTPVLEFLGQRAI